MTITQGIINWAIVVGLIASGAISFDDIMSGAYDPTAGDTGTSESGTAESDSPDYDGYAFNIADLTTDDANGWLVDELNGEVLNDALVERRRWVEERHNITIDTLVTTSGGLSNAILAGEDIYDLVDLNVSDFVPLAADNMFIDVNKVDGFDFTQPHWDSRLMDSLRYGEKNYFVAGAANLSTYEATHILVYNKRLAEEQGVGDLAALVNSGEWTIDKFGEISRDAFGDVNGNSVIDREDSLGYIAYESDMLTGFMAGADVKLIGMAWSMDYAVPTFGLQNNIRFGLLIDRLTSTDIELSRLCVPAMEALGDRIIPHELFAAGNALFCDASVGDLPSLGGVDFELGIAPYPKLEADQTDEWYSVRVEDSAVTALPITSSDLERTAVIAEAIQSVSNSTVLPACYEEYMMCGALQSSESIEMLEFAFAHRRFDLGDAAWGELVRDRIAVCLAHGNGMSLDDAPTLSELAARYKVEIDKLCADCAIYW
ncbi:MAG TPA: hypothetical protein H9681_09025 [Firmicutes bacterium]|nr:hypothetical protein [Bacillota bacterium]